MNRETQIEAARQHALEASRHFKKERIAEGIASLQDALDAVLGLPLLLDEIEQAELVVVGGDDKARE